jgi:hypothetical protein
VTVTVERPLTWYEALHLEMTPALPIEECRRCGNDLPWDEELYCDTCRSLRPRTRRCSNCGDPLSCDCCDECDDCSTPTCEACDDSYDPDDGGEGYCGPCYRERLCTNCDCVVSADDIQDGLCTDCQPEECYACSRPAEEDSEFCTSCQADYRCTECTTEYYSTSELVLGVCSTCREEWKS